MGWLEALLYSGHETVLVKRQSVM